MRVSLVCLALTVALAAPTLAIDLVTDGHVEIVDGITVNQTTGLNFGVLALNSGAVTVAAADGAITDPDNLMADNTNVSQAVFTVASITGSDLTAAVTVGAMPAGITLSAFTMDWADAGAEGPAPQDRTLASDTESLEVGATITVDRATAAVTGAPAALPYTLSVTYQ